MDPELGPEGATAPLVSLVLVSHSSRVAEGVAELATAMASSVRIIAAGGLAPPENALGTDANRIAGALAEAWSPAGVLVLMDLGSAVLSAELAREMLDPEKREMVCLSEAALVEGAVAAAVAAQIGEPLKAVALAAAGGLEGKAGQLGSPAAPPSASDESSRGAPTGDWLEFFLQVDLPMGLHARPSARLIQATAGLDAEVTVENASAGRGPVSGRSLNGLASLQVRQGEKIKIRARGAQAETVLAAVRRLSEARFGEPANHEPIATPDQAPPPGQEAAPVGALVGLPASPGVAVASVVRMVQLQLEVPNGASGSAEQEDAALTAALQRTREELLELRAITRRRAGEYEAGIIDADLLFLEDPELVGAARNLVAEGVMGAARAWSETTAAAGRRWDGFADPNLRLRAADLEGVARRVLAHLLGVPVSAPSGRGILIAEELAPTDTADLRPQDILGIATAGGGPTSHTVILARSLGIPAVVGLGPKLLEVGEGSPALLDGDQGFLLPNPSPAAELEGRARAVARAKLHAAAKESAQQAAITQDGVVVEVAANIGSVADARRAVEAGADGVGLLRTEFLFQGAPEMPDERSQIDLYQQIAVILGDRPLTIRTLDAGADKPLPYIVRPREDNPALGVRGIRLGLQEPALLRGQLRAIEQVSRSHRVRVMFPMVASAAEVVQARRLLAGLRRPESVQVKSKLEVGIMVEVPAAALAARVLAPLVDFMSIGTNDLSQYTMAADRTNPGVAALADPLHPAVLRLIRDACRAGSATGAWVGVCGELAGEAKATELLIGLGVRELSMSPPRIPEVKQAVRRSDSIRALRLADAAVELAGADEVRQLLDDRSKLSW